ncbi:RRP15-like protein [Cylas formicarius]|uniref:RRP15-like protein n=1 Tax=Cylas formicarius TaxID=197179 RepID=UPI002958D549|nr:RRP15-like protein [Cylas formicarius]
MTVKTQKAKIIIDEDGLHSNSDSEHLVDDEDSEIEVTDSKSIKIAKKRARNRRSDSDTDDLERQSEVLDDESAALLNEGWADSIARILRTNKPKKKKSTALSKAKKLTEVKRKTLITESYEIATGDGEIKKETIVKEEEENADERSRRKRRELPNLRVKPNILEKDRERTLQKIATRGVVQLFNAVRTQQKDISKKLEEAGPLEVRKEKVLKSIDKRAFLDVLMGEKSTRVDEAVKTKENKAEKKNDNGWNVLREDFMMSAKMKDWDKEIKDESEADVEMEKEMDVESD